MAEGDSTRSAGQPSQIPDRSRWVVALAAAPREPLQSLAERLAEALHAVPMDNPRAGLAMLTLRDAVLLEPFNLGEIPLSRAYVQLTDAAGRQHHGAAQVMADDVGLAVALAICDGVLASRLPGWEQVLQLLQQGEQSLSEQQRIRQGMLARTQVKFSLLNQHDQEGSQDRS